MALNDLYEIVAFQNFQGQECVNVYHYHQFETFLPIGQNNANSLVDAWIAQILPSIRAAQIPNVVYTKISAINLFSPSDRHDELVSLAGTRVVANDQPMPVHDAVAVSLETGSAEIRTGRKSYTGIGEGDHNSGNLFGSGAAVWATASSILKADVTIGTIIQTPTFRPVVVKRVKVIGSGDEISYRLPENASEAVYSPIITALADLVISTMNSRKR